jgi:predicted  nucleic acid-binding Zn-ribbon protein
MAQSASQVIIHFHITMCAILTYISVGCDPDAEAPETPAPVFAARALKSAFFGTPGFPQDDTLYGVDKEDIRGARTDRPIDIFSTSPTKPTGILMTPGAGATRRKTVSFGSEVVDREGRGGSEKIINRAATPGKPSSLETSTRDKLSQPIRKTPLLKTLEDSRDIDSAFKERNQLSTAHSTLPYPSLVKEKETARSKVNTKEAKKARAKDDNLFKQFTSDADNDGDFTVDMNDPRSMSGKFWKSEFQRYHDEAQEQMTNLVRYKQLAKSYAKKKDAEALDLAEKLKEEQSKVATMENNISELMRQISEAGKVDGDASPEMMRDLARQTALAFQYRVQVEEFRKAVEGDGTLAAALPKADSKITKDDPTDVKGLREELEKARQALSSMEKTASKLREENNKLSQDLLHSDLRFEKHTESCEKRLKLAEEQRHKKDERLQSLQKEYDHIKQTAKNNRREAERLLRQRHDQVVGLKKEIASLKTAQTTVQELQQSLDDKATEHDRTVEGYKTEIALLKEGIALFTSTDSYKNGLEYDHLDLFRTTNNSVEKPALPGAIPVSSHSLARPSKTVITSKPTHSETSAKALGRRSSYAALSEITNYATSEKLAFQKSGKVEYTPLAKRFSDPSLNSSQLDLTPAEPSLPLLPHTRKSHESRCTVSPRPKMFNIPSSPPKATIARSRTVDQPKLSNDVSASRHMVNSSRLSSIGGSKKSFLPPDRVAAAKARLAAKNAEKKRARAMGADSFR